MHPKYTENIQELHEMKEENFRNPQQYMEALADIERYVCFKKFKTSLVINTRKVIMLRVEPHTKFHVCFKL